MLAAGRKRIAQALGDLMRRLRGKSAAAKAPAAPRQAPAAPSPAAASPEVEDAPAEKEPPSAPKHAAAKADDSDERLRDLINGIGTSLRSGLPTGTRGRHAAPARAAADDIDEPPCADNIVEFKPLDGERERERSAAIDLRVPPVPPVRAAAAAACASAAAPVRNYSLNLR